MPRKLDCPRVTKMKKIHTVSLKKIYCAKIQQLGISLHSQITCPPSVYTCFPKSSVCDPSEIILVPHHCSSLKNLQMTKTSLSKSSTLPFVRFLQEMTDTMQETINKLNSDLNFQECQLQYIPFFHLVFSCWAPISWTSIDLPSPQTYRRNNCR